MFKFLKELRDAVKEGIEEGKAELREEAQAMEAEKEEIRNCIAGLGEPATEHMAIALSCPFRSVLISGNELRLFRFNQLSHKETESLAKLLRRDFGLGRETPVSEIIAELEEAHNKGESRGRNVFLASLSLYILTAATDVGYIDFDDAKAACEKYIAEIAAENQVSSWAEFADLFMEGECINNALGRKFLQKDIDSLLEDEFTPWNVIKWEDIQKSVQAL